MKYICTESSYADGVFRRRGDIVEVGAHDQPPPWSTPMEGEEPVAEVKPLVQADFASTPDLNPPDGPLQDTQTPGRRGRPRKNTGA